MVDFFVYYLFLFVLLVLLFLFVMYIKKKLLVGLKTFMEVYLK